VLRDDTFRIVFPDWCHIVLFVGMTLSGIGTVRAERLPDAIYFRTQTESFNRRYYIALRNDTIWYKENEEVTGKPSPWRIFGHTGKPEKKEFDRFGPPARITSISADGIHLMALSETGVFYRGTNLMNNVRHGFEWNDRWGWWGANGPGLKNDIGTSVWSVSDAFPAHLGYYEDGNGRRHSVGFGVAHLYALGADSMSIYYNDWWLPADWSRQVPGPLRGTFVMVNLSASGSTLFVIGKDGRMFTRMYDFDMNGENQLLTYSYVKTGNTGTTRRLPMPDWQQQPPIPDGRITQTVTIFQNGKGNAARVLRVEGVLGDSTGFFYKDIFDTVWKFTATGQPLHSSYLDGYGQSVVDSTEASSTFDRRLEGSLVKRRCSDTLGVEFSDFNIVCPPARVTLLLNGEPLRNAAGEVTFLFYHSQAMVTGIRPADFWDKGMAADIWGALLVPDSLYTGLASEDSTVVRRFFGKQKSINFIGTAARDSLRLEQIVHAHKKKNWVPFFVVPSDEKGNRCEYRLTAAAHPSLSHEKPAVSAADTAVGQGVDHRASP